MSTSYDKAAVVIKIEGDDEKLAIDAIAWLKAFFDDEDAEYNEEFDFAKDDDPHADGNFKLIYSLYPYIKYHSYGKIFIAEIDRFIKTKEDWNDYYLRSYQKRYNKCA